MRLLHTTEHKVKEVKTTTQFAILSHTWEKDEITFQDIERPGANEKEGYNKLRNACSVAAADGFDYIWIDTCCIDKTSSAELSEAINSMYRWYQEAEVCYAYLADVPFCEFSQSRWFTRGWTLQELIAPSTVIFFDKEWEVIGTKSELARLISDRTQIPIGILSGDDIWTASVAQRMSWASKRKTTRIEDLAYCLMGIFDIHMPMIYGEGERAFIRLQEQIMKTSDDFSLFAWRSTENHGGLLATSPAAFDTSHSIVRLGRSDTFSSPISVDNQGVHLKLRFIPQSDSPALGLAVLNCTLIGRAETPIAIYLETTDPTKQYFRRVQSERLHLLDQHDSSWPEIAICVQQPHETPMGRSREVPSFRQRRTGITPLLYAAKRGHKSTVTDLLNCSDVAPNSMDETGRTALWVAAENGHEEVVRVLRDRIDVKADSKDANGRTPLWIAASNGHEQVVRALLDRSDVEADSKDADGWTPLAIAESMGHEAIVKMMEQRWQASQTLACPFLKHYPHKEWPRCQRGWNSVSRLKQVHLLLSSMPLITKLTSSGNISTEHTLYESTATGASRSSNKKQTLNNIATKPYLAKLSMLLTIGFALRKISLGNSGQGNVCDTPRKRNGGSRYIQSSSPMSTTRTYPHPVSSPNYLSDMNIDNKLMLI